MSNFVISFAIPLVYLIGILVSDGVPSNASLKDFQIKNVILLDSPTGLIDNGPIVDLDCDGNPRMICNARLDDDRLHQGIGGFKY